MAPHYRFHGGTSLVRLPNNDISNTSTFGKNNRSASGETRSVSGEIPFVNDAPIPNARSPCH